MTRTTDTTLTKSTWLTKVPTPEQFEQHELAHPLKKSAGCRSGALWLLRPKPLPKGFHELTGAQRARTGAMSARKLGSHLTVLEVYGGGRGAFQRDTGKSYVPADLGAYDWCPLTRRGEPVMTESAHAPETSDEARVRAERERDEARVELSLTVTSLERLRQQHADLFVLTERAKVEMDSAAATVHEARSLMAALPSSDDAPVLVWDRHARPMYEASGRLLGLWKLTASANGDWTINVEDSTLNGVTCRTVRRGHAPKDSRSDAMRAAEDELRRLGVKFRVEP